MVLTDFQISLLSTMIATIGTIWAIAFAAYTFIYRYFADRYLEPAVDMAENPSHPDGPDRVRPRAEMMARVVRNRTVYVWFIAAGFFSAASITFSSVALALANLDWAYAAGIVFAFAIAVHLYVFTKEIQSSVSQMKWLHDQIRRGT